MTTRDDFTDEEWQSLASMPQLAALGAMASEEGGPVSSTRELWASLRELAEEAQTTYADNALIQAITAALGRHDAGPTLPPGISDASGPEAFHIAVVEQALQTAPAVRAALARGATAQEAAQYVAWIMDTARAGVRAAKTGFLGLEGAPVTPREALFLSELATALGAPAEPEQEWAR